MANIKKSFNFRNGVQVDDDNLKVSATGLVGIGTTVPTEALDVRGNLVVSGVSSAVTAQAGVLTVTTLNPTEIIGAGVSIKSGIVTASSGIITYFGDGINLLNLPTSQWVDTIVGLGVSSIYNAGGNVGIATTAALFTLQIGNDVNSSGQKGVGISSFGDIKASGITTASGFVGPLTGDVTGNVTGNIFANSGVSTFHNFTFNSNGFIFNGTGSNAGNGGTPFVLGLKSNNYLWLSDNFQIRVGMGQDLQIYHSNDQNIIDAAVTGNLKLQKGGVDKLEISGIGASVYGQFNVDGHTELDQLNVSGVSTFVGISTFSDDVFFPSQLKGATGFERLNSVVYDKSDASLNFNGYAYATFGADDPFGRKLRLFSTTSNAPAPTAGSFTIIRALHTNLGIQCGVTSEITLGSQSGETIIRVSPAGAGIATIRNADISQQLTALNANCGIITALEQFNTPICGVGTDTPVNDIQVRKTGDAEIQITSDTGTAGITVGRESGTNNTNNAEFRYGHDTGANYSSAQSLDILNYGTGNFNYHLSANNAGAVDGDFHWHKGINNSTFMTLTGIGGSLGIGITNPSTTLHVLGQATVSGNVNLGGDLNVSGNAALNVVGDVTGTLTGNVNATTGVSTFNRIDLNVSSYYEFGQLSASAIGIGTTMGNKKFVVNADIDDQFQIGDSGRVGIKTDDPNGNALFVNGAIVALDPIGVGTDEPRAAIDFADAGQATTGLAANRMYMVPPKVGAGQTAGLVGLVSGAMIYNTNLNKLQVYNGTNWETITSVEVTG